MLSVLFQSHVVGDARFKKKKKKILKNGQTRSAKCRALKRGRGNFDDVLATTRTGIP